MSRVRECRTKSQVSSSLASLPKDADLVDPVPNFVTASWTTSPVNHNPGLADRPALAYSLALGCPERSAGHAQRQERPDHKDSDHE